MLSACTTTKPEEEPVVRRAQEVTAVQVHSLPPGCFVELNGEFLGATPLTIRVPSYEGDWQGTGWKMHVLRASIPQGQGYEQKIWFGGDERHEVKRQPRFRTVLRGKTLSLPAA